MKDVEKGATMKMEAATDAKNVTKAVEEMTDEEKAAAEKKAAEEANKATK